MHTAARMDDYTRLVTRAGILSGVNHPNVMHLLDAFVGTALVEKPPTDDEDFNVIYTVADWIPGVPFHEAVEAAGPVAGLLWVAEIHEQPPISTTIGATSACRHSSPRY